MTTPITRRDALKQLGLSGTSLLFAGTIRGAAHAPIVIAGQPSEILVYSLSTRTVRIPVRPIVEGTPAEIPCAGARVDERAGTRVGGGTDASAVARVVAGDVGVRYTEGPPTLHVDSASGSPLQRFTLDAAAPGMSFLLGSGPLLGFGEGGAQFDRRGA